MKIKKLRNLERIGTGYGGWVIPRGYFTKESICYCAGVGEDISFDLGLIKKYSCKVFAFDPTPRAKLYVDKTTNNPNFTFFDIGLLDEKAKVKFFSPKDSNHVSHSILNLQKTNTYFEAKVNRLSNIMKELQHRKIDLLKLDIEGAEYKVIDSIIEDNLEIDIICVEFDEAYNRLDDLYLERIRNSLSKLSEFGYVIIHVEPKCNYTLIKEERYNSIINNRNKKNYIK